MLGFIVNCGSSSIKARIIDTARKTTIYEARAEHLNSDSAKLTTKSKKSENETIVLSQTHKEAIELIVEDILSSGTLITLDSIDFVAHRIVHGGNVFSKPTIINVKILEKISEFNNLAPLHNPIGIEGAEICLKLFSEEIPQIAIFDTAFHQTISETYFRYALPNSFFENGVRKYGFHGISYAYSTRILKEKFNVKNPTAIIAHLGQGSSVCGIKNGESVYTSMEFGPVSGCIMGTRSGTIDPTILYHMCHNHNYPINQLFRVLNSESGLYAITGKNNMIDVIEGAKANEDKCILALEMFCISVVEYLANAVVALGEKPKQIVFSGGIGENSDIIREKILKKLSPILSGILLDDSRNAEDNVIISADDSFIPVYVIPVNEELEIAYEAEKLLDGFYS